MILRSPLSIAPHARGQVRLNGHTPAHRALNEFVIPAFTLHLHP